MTEGIRDDITDLGAGRGPEWLDHFLSNRLPDLVTFRREVHEHPELSRHEIRTTARLSAALQDAGLAPRTLPVGTGVVADLGEGRERIALRADIDALPLREASGLPFASTVPGAAHACGHDIHQTVVLGAGLALAAAAAEGIAVPPVRLIFQPAEEVMPGGAHDVVAAGEMAGVARIFAVHCDPKVPAGLIGLRVGPITSTSDLVRVTVTGPGGHTSRPHLTADLVTALGLLATEVPLLVSRRLDPRSAPVMVWGAVHAGEAANAIPQQGELTGTLRLMRREAWDGAEQVVRDVVAGVLAPTGAGHTVEFRRGVPPVDNDAYSVALLRAGAVAALGPGAVTETEQSTGAEDFAVLLDHAPGALARLGVWDGAGEQCDLHSAGFRADERAIAAGTRTLVHTVLAAARG